MKIDHKAEGGKLLGVKDWKVQEKGTTVILTRLHGAERVCLWFSTKHGDSDKKDDDDEYTDEEDDDDDDDDDNHDDDDDDDDDDDEEDEEEKINKKKKKRKGDDDNDSDDNDNDNDDDDDDDDDDYKQSEEDAFITCKISFYKPRMGVLLITTHATEKSFIIRSIAHSSDPKIATERTPEMDWEYESLYFGKATDLEESMRHNFDAYLLDRGINEDLALCVTRYAEEKEEKEKTKWLRTIQTFISN